MGGAPANVAFHLASSRAVKTTICSRIGNDPAGRDLRQWLAGAGIDTGLLQVDETNPTGVVRVRSENDQAVYDIVSPAAWDHIAETSQAMETAVRSSVVVYGTLAQRHPVSRSTIRAMVARARASGALAVADLNLRSPFFDGETVMWTLRNCDVLKLNSAELQTVSALLGAHGEEQLLFEGLVREFQLPRAVLTRGDGGALVFESGAVWREASAPVTKVSDTVGAGDSVTAIMAASLALGVPWQKAMPLAAEVAAYVVSQEGAMPPWPRELVDRARRLLPCAH